MSLWLALAMAMAPPQTGTIDWAALPALPYRTPPQLAPQMTGFVVRAVRTGHCPTPPAEQGSRKLIVDLAVLIDEEDEVRAVVPRAINCPAVEQYAAGLVSGFARNNLLPRRADGGQWYRASLTFSWKQ